MELTQLSRLRPGHIFKWGGKLHTVHALQWRPMTATTPSILYITSDEKVGELANGEVRYRTFCGRFDAPIRAISPVAPD